MEAISSRFTAAEGGSRLATATTEQNTIAADHRSFIATRLLYEEAYKIRGALCEGKQRSIYITRPSRVKCVAYDLNILTDLRVTSALDYDRIYDWNAEVDLKEIIVTTSCIVKRIFEEEILKMANINVLVIESCHLICKDDNLKYIMKLYKESAEDERPRILGLTYPLFSTSTKNNTKVPTDITSSLEENTGDLEINKHDNIQSQNNDIDNDDKSLEQNNRVDSKNANDNIDNSLGNYENYDDFEMYEKLEWKIDTLEEELCCKADLAEDIDGVKRFSSTTTKPRELIVQYSSKTNQEMISPEYVELENYMRDTVSEAMEFLKEHRYDPTEIYGEDMYDELRSIPDPTLEPRNILAQFLYVLDQLGPYGADKAAFSLLTKLEKLKIKVPYERHFLLLCLCTTVFVRIRCFCEEIFSKYEDDWQKIKKFCTPKVIRFAEILEKFEPPSELNFSTTRQRSNNSCDTNEKSANYNENDKEMCDNDKKERTKDLLKEIESCDFATLGNRLEDKVNILESNLKDIVIDNYDTSATNIIKQNDNDTPIRQQADKSVKNEHDKQNNETYNLSNNENDNFADSKQDNLSNNDTDNFLNNKENNLTNNENDNLTNNENDKEIMGHKIGFHRRQNRVRGRGRMRNVASRIQQAQLNPDALCAIVYIKEALMAKILFMIVVELSRSNPKLDYISAQYSATEKVADPSTEPRDYEQQRKKQEEVLKKFRMHECNLLLATSAIEEGIDLPRCNLVLRWDIPQSYRSYGLCRDRARAPRSSCVVLTQNDLSHTDIVNNLATYKQLDQIVSNKCGCGIQNEPTQTEEDLADKYTQIIKAYTPNNKTKVTNNYNDKKNYNKNDNIVRDDESINLVKDNKIEKDNESDNAINVNNLRNDESSFASGTKSGGVTFDVNKHDNNKIDNDNSIASVDLSTAIALINRYCGKLPSDTFTRLAPLWWMEEVLLPVRNEPGTSRTAYICTLRLPLNCPVKYNIVGHPMPTRVLARRMVALQACRILHKSGELDNQLMPIGKDNFKAADLETSVNGQNGGTNMESHCDPNDLARPGTTKRRQYYYKRTARVFTNCQPIINFTDEEIENTKWSSENANATTSSEKKTPSNVLISLSMSLCCALPERYNTRGRRLHSPQDASSGLGLLMAKGGAHRLKIPAFPVYTRSGEVRVSVEVANDADVRMAPRRGRLVRRFMRFVFSDVLRVRRLGMKLQSDGSTHNNYYIVPTVKTITAQGTKVDIDWPFLELIYQHTEAKKYSSLEKPLLWQQDEEEAEDMINNENDKRDNYHNELDNIVNVNDNLELGKTDSENDNSNNRNDKCNNDNEGHENNEKKVKKIDNPLLRKGETFVFDADKYREAVVTPWYRNQDQPQFFLVAEICWNLTPDSAFPSITHSTFREYYSNKYGVDLSQSHQPLLDVDHTSARLNLLTPRYVNRKGVALPVSSERTRRAKRDRLDQKQILVPELCKVHPFAAPLWFATVALPCVLYRINALLIADEIRQAVAIDVGLGVAEINDSTCPGFEWPPLDFGWSLADVLNADSEKTEKKRSIEEQEVTEEEDKVECEVTKQIEEEDSRTEEKLGEVTEEEGEKKEKTINEILEEKEAENCFEIGTWSNDMASSIPQINEYDEMLEPLPSNLTFCTSVSGGTNWCDPVQKPPANNYNPSKTFSMADSDCSYMSSCGSNGSSNSRGSSDFDTDDSDLNSEASDEDTDLSGFCSSKNSNAAMGVRIEYKTAHEAEAVDVERKKKIAIGPQPDEADDYLDKREQDRYMKSGQAPKHYIDKFHNSIKEHKTLILNERLVKYNEEIKEILPEVSNTNITNKIDINENDKLDNQLDKLSLEESALRNNVNDKYNEVEKAIKDIFPYGNEDTTQIIDENGEISLEKIEVSKRELMELIKINNDNDKVENLQCFSMKDINIDAPDYVNKKLLNIGFDRSAKRHQIKGERENVSYYSEDKNECCKEFDFDYQPELGGHPGPSPSLILQALTMSNANDGINLERLETIGDSFLKFAITAYLYCAHPTVHEGKLSHMRSKQVSNLNLYRLGRNKKLGSRMIASKFEPHDNWLPPCHRPPSTLPVNHTNKDELKNEGCFIPYNLITQHSIPDKSIADCVEALIGAYLLSSGRRGALLLMCWLGLTVLPHSRVEVGEKQQKQDKTSDPANLDSVITESSDDEGTAEQNCDDHIDEDDDDYPHEDWSKGQRIIGSLRPYKDKDGKWYQIVYGELKAPPSPLLRYIKDPDGELERMLSGYEALERTLQYSFRDRSLLLQAMTHASHHRNRLTDCYQRLEFLGDAILDYLITRHLYEDKRRHSPGALTDLRSALVNNTIFATLAVRHGFHKYFRHMSPGLNEVLAKYVKIQEENGHSISEEHYLIQEDEMEQAEDVEVPKALGDLFESVAGAIFLDSGMSLDAVWKSYVTLMGAELEAFSAAAPKSPVRELLEAEPDTAKFGKPERLADGRRVRVCVEVFGRGCFKGVGRNYRIAKGTAARCALRHLKKYKAY